MIKKVIISVTIDIATLRKAQEIVNKNYAGNFSNFVEEALKEKIKSEEK